MKPQDWSGVWYLAGPMSGIPGFNIPAFDAAAIALRAQGLTVVSPAELDDPEARAACLASPDGKKMPGCAGTWGDVLSRDVKLVADKVTGIILLDDWTQSRGARLEAFVGLLCQHKFARYRGGQLIPWSRDLVRVQLGDRLP